MKIIPAIDILNGKCVRLSQGNYNSPKVYYENPLDIAIKLEQMGFQYLHLVDLDGARSKHIVNQKVLNQIATKTNMRIDFGGGIKSMNDFTIALNSGAEKVTIGSMAAMNPKAFILILEQYGSEKVILGADCNQGKIATQGWLNQTNLDVIDFINQHELNGIKHVICTDIARDGMLKGPPIKLYKEILKRTGISLIASGGIGSFQDLQYLHELGCQGAILGKAIYENKIDLKKLSQLC